CTDNAGNVATPSKPLKYDATPPTATATGSRPADTNGWYNHPLTVNVAGSDATAGIAGCSSVAYNGPDSSGATVSGSCTDNAGNVTTASLPFKYDATPPTATASASRPADTNGWYNHPLTISFSATDATAGLAACSPTAEYGGPDSSGPTVVGSCTDKAGNVGAASLPLKYDATPPAARAEPSRAPNANGWYNSALTVRFSGTDATAGLAGCSSPTDYSSPDSVGVTVVGFCTDNAGNVGTTSLPFKYDATPPTATAAASRGADTNGWYNHPLTARFSGADATAGIAGCSSPEYSGPDSASATVGGSCTDLAGNIATASLALKYDSTPPTAKATASRAADANGWYNHALTVRFSGTDATAGIAGCSSVDYTGPDAPSATVSGSCTDGAGNVGSTSMPLKYDATPPTVSKVTAKAGDRRVDLSWNASADVEDFQVTRAPGKGDAAKTTIYQGRAKSYRDAGLSVGKDYRYSVTGSDEAGNTASATIAITATGPLLSPPPGAKVDEPPVLVWTPVTRARYYNLQLVRGSKILSVWPRHSHFRVPRSWVFQGHRYRLREGSYRWYVWPGFGQFSAARYGRSLGGSSFVVVSKTTKSSSAK
ncbi:MAG TPA: hypothetical protein VGJ38_16465, partial [Jatrophihabitantaceae bacterium]